MAHRESDRAGLLTHIAQRMFSGLLVLVPMGVTVFILSLLFSGTVGALASVLGNFIKEKPLAFLYALSAVLLVVVTYGAGALASHVVGRRLIALGERVVTCIPIIKSIYSAAKQVVDLFQNRPEGKTQRIVLVEFPSAGLWSIGFMTGTMVMPGGVVYYKVFVSTTPNPTTGFFILVSPKRCRLIDLSSEEAFGLIMSAGVLAPPCIKEAAPRSTEAS